MKSMIKARFPLPVHVLVGFFLFTVSACEFDQDSQFFPETTQSVFLTSSETSDKHLLFIQDQEVDSTWEVHLGIGLGQLSDMHSLTQELWVSSSSQALIAEVDVSNRTLGHRIQTGSFRPHFIGVGNDRIVASDTIANQLGFWNKDNFRVTIIDVGSRPGLINYRSGKFYIQIGGNAIGIWDERAIAERNRIATSTPIIDILIDNSVSTIAFHKDNSGQFETRISFNTDHSNRQEFPVPHQKIRYTPFLRQSLGKELTSNVILIDSSLIISGLQNISDGVEDFEADFTDSEVWFVKEKSLRLYKIIEEREDLISSFSGSLIKSFFNQEIVGD